MSDSMFGSLLNMLDKRSIGDVAHALGQPEQMVSKGMESSIAALMGGLASKAEDTGALRRIMDLASSTTGPVSWAQTAAGLTDPNSPIIAAGKRFLPAIFGGTEKDVTNAIGREAGLSSGAMSTLLSMAAPVVISFLGKMVRDGGLTMSGLSGLLQKESSTIQNALPPGVSRLIWPGTERVATATASPVIAQEVTRESSFSWLPVLALCGLGLGLLWFLTPSRKPVVPSVALGTANRIAEPLPAAPKTVCSIPSGITLPQGGAAARFLEFVQTPDSRVTSNSWFGMDEVVFDSGSATLKPEARAQLDNFAAILTNCPSVHINVAGYTDSKGNPAANQRLSENRAKNVVARLESKGVPSSRLGIEGHGEEYPVADNETAEGRAQNRRAAIQVTQK
jgi:outer membrane protein OmpA-like peptidoglycan-associated protein